jgi:hypothetical protein
MSGKTYLENLFWTLIWQRSKTGVIFVFGYASETYAENPRAKINS